MNENPNIWDFGFCLVKDYQYTGVYKLIREEMKSQYLIDGVEYVHPVINAQYALSIFNKYLLNKGFMYYE